jgi:hypothetical protein
MDWQDNRISGQQLGQAVERWHCIGAKPGVGYSNGGIVSAGISRRVEQKREPVVLMAYPGWSTQSDQDRVRGLDTLFRAVLTVQHPERARDLIRTFPSAYQLIPLQDPFLGPE